ncbi:hypothetical protein F4604DRAFT_1571097 [Suillus subluteus]|nr:hypothetical protein F4604DRAFT_1571097 [Suillus subluteus]
MISCNFLVQIHEALCEAKENSALFGGISIIFAGDFAQLPPVGQRGLHRKVNTYAVSTSKGQNGMFGKLLWLSVTTVVLLKIVMRQTGGHNIHFVELLGRLRTVKPNWEIGKWLDAPVIVSTNEVKDIINVRATLAYAQYTHQSVDWYHCVDKHSGHEIDSPNLRSHLKRLHSGSTSQRLWNDSVGYRYASDDWPKF